MDELIQAMSIEELLKFKESYPGNTSLATIVDGYIEVKQREVDKAEAKAKFEKEIAKLVVKLPHPEDVYNVYLRWAKTDEPMGEVELVELPDGGTEERQATTEVWKWVVETNKALPVLKSSGKGSGNGSPKRMIVVKKLEGDTVTTLGTYESGADFCRQHEIDYTNNSPIRALKSQGYLPFLAADGKAI